MHTQSVRVLVMLKTASLSSSQQEESGMAGGKEGERNDGLIGNVMLHLKQGGGVQQRSIPSNAHDQINLS